MALEDRLLLKTFAFLKAGSVLATAQVCKPFFTRVDAIFGMGSSINSAPPPPPPPPPTPAFASAPASAVAPSSVAVETPTGGRVGGGGGGGAPDSLSKIGVGKTPAMDVELAKKIAAKLNPQEMKGIVQMVERIKRLEGVLGHLNEVKEDTDSRLQATESVKDFLVEKLKDTEVALKRTVDGANEAARQHQANQEVISFLDSRVQDLEAQLAGAEGEKQAAERAVSEKEREGSVQSRSLEELLVHEKEKFASFEAEAKAQRKLLVKEVKSLRVQLVQVTSERDACLNLLNSGR